MHDLQMEQTPLNNAGFGDRLWRLMRSRGPICVGIDPHQQLLEQWNLPDSPQGLHAFSMKVLDTLADHVAAFKPQSAFFERHGAQGIAVLEEIIGVCHELGTICIVDAKRGDIGSTMEAYADAYLSNGSPLAGDAVTVSPYLGVGSLNSAFEHADASHRGIFTLALTSNPEGARVQHAKESDGISVASDIIAEISQRNNRCEFMDMGPYGVVIGATVGSAITELGIDLNAFQGPILAPGVGAQGASATQVKDLFGGAIRQVLVSTSRAVLRGGPDSASLFQAFVETRDDMEYLR